MYDNLMRPFPTPEIDRLHVQLRQVQTSEHTPLDAATVYNVLDRLPELYTYALDVHCRTVLDRTSLQSLVAPIFEHFFQTVALCPPRLRQLAMESLASTPLHQTLLTEFVAQNPMGDDNSFNATLDSTPNNLFQTMAYRAVSECHSQMDGCALVQNSNARWSNGTSPEHR